MGARHAIPVVSAALALAAGGCGAVDEPPGGEAPGTGTLEVVVELADDRPLFIEGSLTEVEVRDDDGRVVIDEQSDVPRIGEPILRRELPAGRYALRTVQRPCQGNCNYLDPPVMPCSTEVRIVARLTATARLRLSPHGCAIKTADG